MLLTLLAGVAQEENMDCFESVKWGIRKKFEQGETTPFKILGYKLIDVEIVVVDDEAKLVKIIFDIYVSGLQIQKIANILTEEGIKTRTISKLGMSTIRGILRNEEHKGDLRFQKSFISDHISKKKKEKNQMPQYYVEANHPYIIKPETFDKVRRILDSKRNKETKELELSCFSGKLMCDVCETRYTKKKTNGIVKWQCRTFETRGKKYCASKTIREDVLISITAKVLNIHEFDEIEFSHKIAHIIVCNNNILKCSFKDGSMIETT